LAAKAGATLTASIPTIMATTVNNTTMRLMKVPPSVVGVPLMGSLAYLVCPTR
jgi:hypothetical protein